MVEQKGYWDDEDDDEDISESELEAKGSLKHIQLTELDVELEKASNKDRHTLLFDKSGQAETYFQYKAKCRELHKDLISIKMGKALLKNIIEKMRSSLVYSMKTGEVFCLSISRLEPNWKKDFNNSEFPSDLIFNFEEWRRYTNYMKIVKEDENKNMQGDQGMYCMQKSHKLTILASYVDEEHMARVIDALGENIEQFRIMMIDEPEKFDGTLHARNTLNAMSIREKTDDMARLVQKDRERTYAMHMDDQLDYYSKFENAVNDPAHIQQQAMLGLGQRKCNNCGPK